MGLLLESWYGERDSTVCLSGNWEHPGQKKCRKELLTGNINLKLD